MTAGTTYRSGTRFGPQGMRRISALYGTYSFELGVDLRESVTIADVGDIFTIPGNIEKTFDQITKGVSHVFASGAFPVVLGGDHSIGYPTVRGVAEHLAGNLGIIHFDRHVDTQETDLDERMHTTPWFHATDIANVPARNLVQLGIGGWQAPRPGVKVCRERETTIMTVNDCVNMGIERAAETALEVAWDGAEAVWLSFDVDCLDAAFVPGTGWPEPGGFLPREALELVQRHCRSRLGRDGDRRVLTPVRQRRNNCPTWRAGDLRRPRDAGQSRPPPEAHRARPRRRLSKPELSVPPWATGGGAPPGNL